MEHPLIELREVGLAFREAGVVFERLAFRLDRGDVVCIDGPSGSGKSTLLRVCAMLQRIDRGEVVHGGAVVARDGRVVSDAHRVTFGWVPQELALWPHLSVRENIIVPLVIAKKRAAEAAAQVADRLLDRFGLHARRLSTIDRLSVGQQQRVAIARAVAVDPDILLFDEPTSALDRELIRGIQELIAELVGDGRTMIIVTHDAMFARHIATRRLTLRDGVLSAGESEQGAQ